MFKYASTLPHGIKLVTDSIIKKHSRFSNIKHFFELKYLIQNFINNPSPMVVPVYSWEDYPNQKNWSWYEYSYTMKRMCLLSKEEKHVVSICCKLFSATDQVTIKKFEKQL